MTTMTIDRATVEQALEILEKLVVGSDYEEAVEAEQAMESFRAALAQQAEPVALTHRHEWFGGIKQGQFRCIHCGAWVREKSDE